MPLIEIAVCGPAEEGGPFGGRKHQGWPGGVPGVAVRDSKDRGKTPHVFNRHEWECFLIGAKNGEFDLPVS